MVMAAEIDVTLNVCVFEELTSIQSMNEGLWLIKMRPSYNVVTGHPTKTVDWQRFYFYVKADESAFEDPPDDDYRVLWNTVIGRVLSLSYASSMFTDYVSSLLFFLQLSIRPRPSIQKNFLRTLVP